MSHKQFFFILAVILVHLDVLAINTDVQEQNIFSAEEEQFNHSVALPKTVLQVFRKDSHVLSTLKMNNLSPDQLPQIWFIASEIHLSNSQEADLIVMGIDELRGANINTFWIFQKVKDNYNLVLKAAVHHIEILQTKSNGLKDLRLTSATAIEVLESTYRFNGKEYQKIQ